MSIWVELVIEAHLHCCYSDRKPSHDLLDLDIFNNCPSTGANQAASNCFKPSIRLQCQVLIVTVDKVKKIDLRWVYSAALCEPVILLSIDAIDSASEMASSLLNWTSLSTAAVSRVILGRLLWSHVYVYGLCSWNTLVSQEYISSLSNYYKKT